MALIAAALGSSISGAQDTGPIPHGQRTRPGAPLSAAEAAKKMTVPPGFAVEVVASEPDIVNPVAMTIDERGRFWITESLEYPRHEPGPGRDRVKVLDDTDGDGKADKFTVFAEGLNIPSGIAVGHGGVWVANAPDILFLQDRDGDGKADHREVVVTGFGRYDTHELPNSLTWGPDGWLYGWNGVFNPSRVVYRGKTHEFTCAIFRIHPRTRDFELFCEGTSNPWGIAWDPEGSAFASACVIDHLWHLAQTGYYHRQGGPYPPFTWKIGSIVEHKHQQAAYCGIHYFDSDAYPPEYRDRLYMGNIHGNCINSDVLKRNGSTYHADPVPDFLTAHDAWFMPVVQKTGPDGSLYILDWYDRYHCYQDANRDPAGIDRLKGRLYRVRYKETPRRAGFDLARDDDARLIERLSSANVYDRDIAQRLLAERNTPAVRKALEAAVLESARPRKGRLHALWARVGCGSLDERFTLALLSDEDATFRAWGVRASANAKKVDDAVRTKVASLVRDPSPDVRLQVAIASRRIEGIDALPVLLDVLSASESDPLIPHIVWQNLQPLLEDRGEQFATLIAKPGTRWADGSLEVLPRAIERLLAARKHDPATIVRLVTSLAEVETPAYRGVTCEVFEGLGSRIQTGEITGADLAALRAGLSDVVRKARSGDEDSPLSREAAFLSASWKDPAGIEPTRAAFRSSEVPPEDRVRALRALIAAGDRGVIDVVAGTLADVRKGSDAFRGQVLSALGRLDDPRVATVVLDAYPKLGAALQPRAIELLSQRPAWGLALMKAIGGGTVAKDAVNVNQVRALLGSNDPALVALVKSQWGTVRAGRNPERERVVAQVRTMLRGRKGDPHAGQKVFQKICAQCHKIYGEGQDVGPEITRNGRASVEQLLSNVLDPSLVIGAAYQATIVATADGRVLTGLLVENNANRIQLKTQGGKIETIPRADVEETKVSPLSLMPEDLEKQLKPQELVDLFAFLSLDRPPSDPKAKPIPDGKRD